MEDGVDLDLLRQEARGFLTSRGERDSVKELAAMDGLGCWSTKSLGGTGWRPVEACVVAEELGRAQDGSAWFGTVLAAAALSSAPVEVRDRWLPALLGGTASAGFAVADDVIRVTCATPSTSSA